MVTLLRVLVVICAFAAGSLAQAQVSVPPLTGRVVDLTGTLSQVQVQALAETLRDFETRKGSQLAVLIVPTTQPETIEQYGIRVADQWKLGRKGIDDGAILIVAKNDRTVRIEVGYGLEGVLNDATANRIITETIVPQFRQGDFAGGIRAGADRMMQVIQGEPLPEPAPASNQGGVGLRHYALIALLLSFFLGGVFRSILGRVPGGIVTGGALGYLAWLVSSAVSVAVICGLIGLVVTMVGGRGIGPGLMVGGRRRGTGWVSGYGGFGSGYGGSGGLFGGGGAGGGFRGGGGGFGGGGASGRW